MYDHLEIPGPPAFQAAARDILDVVYGLDPSAAAGAGLFEESVRVPSYTPAAVAAAVGRLDHDLDVLRSLPWGSLPVDTQIDVRLVYAAAETARHQLVDERVWTHRPGQWLEPYANTLIAYAGYAPERPELQDRLLTLLPAMAAEVPVLCTAVTTQDLKIGRELVDALDGIALARNAPPAQAALARLRTWMDGVHPTRDYAVVGADAYAWRFAHTLLLPWSPQELLARAMTTLAAVEERMDALPPAAVPVATPAHSAAGRLLDQAGLLALYDAASEQNRALTTAGGWVTISDRVGPIRARPTPAAMIPLTGDGGSMNPPPTVGTSNVGFWNVNHIGPDTPQSDREQTVAAFATIRTNGMAMYSAHEGFPGHHLQLSIARLNPDPLRSILADPVQNEGWGLYAEEVFYEHGGADPGPDGQRAYLGSYRGRIARVIYDVNVETERWTLQQGADFRARAEPGKGQIGPEMLRAINWPSQLIAYYAGKQQILELREAWRARMGAAYTDRGFHDAFLAEGSIPIALIRAKMMGEPVPGL